MLVDDRTLLRVIEPVTGEVLAEHALVAPGETCIVDDHYGGPRPDTPRRAARPRTAGREGVPGAGAGRRGVPDRCRRGRGHQADHARSARSSPCTPPTAPSRCSPRWSGRSRSAGGGPPTSARSWPPTGAAPTPRPAGQALVLTLPTVPTRSLDAYRIDHGGGDVVVTATTPPPLPADLTEGLKRLKMAAMRQLAPELLVTAKTQRWNPEEFLRTLVEAEIAARDASNARTRLTPGRVPGDQDPRRVRRRRVLDPAGDLRLPRLAGMGPGRGERLPDRTGRHRQEPRARRARRSPPSRPGTGSATSPPPTWSRPSTAAWPTTPSAGSSTPCSATTSSSSTSSASPRWTTPAPNCCSGSSPPPTNAASLGIGSHWPFESWGRFLPEHTTAVSMLDRLLHHCHTVVTDGDSYRMKQARAKGGTRLKTS